MWPSLSSDGESFVLLDTEGLHDADKSDEERDVKLFQMTLLLSSTVVYNMKGMYDNKDFVQLGYVRPSALC